MKRRVIASLFVLLVLLLCAGLVWFNFFKTQKINEFFANSKPPVQTVSTTEVRSRSWQPGITAIGTARAAQGVQLAVQANGLIKEIRFKANDKVKAGDVLVQLDDAVERADLYDAQTAVKINEIALARSQTLKRKGFDSQAALDTALGALEAARGKLANTQAVIETKVLKAPFTGTIGIPSIDLGQYVSAGTVVATLQDLDNMVVDFTVPEQMVQALSLGQPILFGLAENRLDLTGEITGIDPRGDPLTRLVNVRASISASADKGIIPGRFVQVRVQLPEEQGVVTVPQTSVVTSLYGDYVYKVVPNDAEAAARNSMLIRQVFVKTGRLNEGNVEVLDGLAPGDVIVSAGQNKLQPGAKVKIDNSIDITKPALAAQ
jgi:membrane fusion protein (multidrug efflux system)